jgi:hypothetical protein
MFLSTHRQLRYIQGNCVKRVQGRNGPQNRSGCPNNNENLNPALHPVNISYIDCCWTYSLSGEIFKGLARFGVIKSLAVAWGRRSVVTFGSLWNIFVRKINYIVKWAVKCGLVELLAGKCADKVSSEQKFAVLFYITFASVSYFQNISPASPFAYIYI